jgi:hypothetical protein
MRHNQILSSRMHMPQDPSPRLRRRHACPSTRGSAPLEPGCQRCRQSICLPFSRPGEVMLIFDGLAVTTTQILDCLQLSIEYRCGPGLIAKR